MKLRLLAVVMIPACCSHMEYLKYKPKEEASGPLKLVFYETQMSTLVLIATPGLILSRFPEQFIGQVWRFAKWILFFSYFGS